MTTTVMRLPGPRDYELMTRDGPVTIHAVLLGQGTSHSALHSHVEATAPPGVKCRACRWSETKIFRLVENAPGSIGPTLLGAYVIYTCGGSSVPGEITKTRLVRTDEPGGVIEALVVQRFERGELLDTFITRPAADALDDATNQDERLNDALEAWLDDPVHEAIYDAA